MADFCDGKEGGGSPSRIATNEAPCGFADGKQSITTGGILRHPEAVGKPEINANPCFGTEPFTLSTTGEG